MSKAKTSKIETLTRLSYNAVNSTYHIWLHSIATDKVLAEKQEQVEKLTKEKEGEL